MFKINAMDHIVLNVPDISRSLAFYMDVLGLEPERLDEFRRGAVRFPSVRVSPDTVIDLFPLKPGEALGDGPGLQNLNHFTMVVEAADFEGFQKHLAEHGVRIEEGDGELVGMGSRSISGIPTRIASRSGAIHRTLANEIYQMVAGNVREFFHLQTDAK